MVIAFFVILCIACIIGAVSSSRKNSTPENNCLSDEQARYFDEERKLWAKGLDAKSSKKAYEILDELETGYKEIGKSSPVLFSSSYRENIQDVRELADALAKEEWEEKANRILDKFIDLYLMITSPDFQDVEKAYRSKKRCIGYWQDYFASVPDGLYVYPKSYMKEYLDEDYDSCMESHVALEKKLSVAIDEMKPEYQRKKQLKSNLLSLVENEGSIMRSQLLNHQFEGCIEKEVQYCYRELITNYSLVEVKIGSRYFVSLSDKEKEKREKIKKE